jgi:hypothetical protein
MTGIELFELYNSLSEQEKIRFDTVYSNDNQNEISSEYSELELIERRLSVASSLQSIYDKEGRPYFDVEWIVKTIFHFSDEELKQAHKTNKVSF